jgi:hypothetical protein
MGCLASVSEERVAFIFSIKVILWRDTVMYIVIDTGCWSLRATGRGEEVETCLGQSEQCAWNSEFSSRECQTALLSVK